MQLFIWPSRKSVVLRNTDLPRRLIADNWVVKTGQHSAVTDRHEGRRMRQFRFIGYSVAGTQCHTHRHVCGQTERQTDRRTDGRTNMPVQDRLKWSRHCRLKWLTSNCVVNAKQFKETVSADGTACVRTDRTGFSQPEVRGTHYRESLCCPITL